jgi:hypothetical protein
VSFGTTTVDELRANIASDQDDLRNRWRKRERVKEQDSNIINNLYKKSFDEFVKIDALNVNAIHMNYSTLYAVTYI